MLKRLAKIFTVVNVVVLLGSASVAQAAEVSLINGFYKSTKVEDGLETSIIQLGGRYSEYLSARTAWYADVTLALKTYSAPSNEPGGMNDILLGGGARYFFARISEKITPYVSGGGYYQNTTTEPNWSAATATWTEESGLFYRGDLGLRLNFDSNAFIEIETNLFNSPLTSKQSVVVKTPTNKNEGSVDRIDLFVDTQGSFNNITVSAGMKI